MQEGTNVVYLARVKGTAYEMGFALGQLYGKEIAANIANLRRYVKEKIEKQLLKPYNVPDFLMDYVYD
jgi:hypothetical protein